MLVTACSKSLSESTCVDVKLCARVDGCMTRGDQPQVVADVCVMEIYWNGNLYDRQKRELSPSKQVEFTATMVAERKYDIVFWAEKDGSYTDTSLREISLSNPSVSPENADAFSARLLDQTISSSTPVMTNVTLTRPLAKISITSPTQITTVTYNAPSKYNLLTDEVSVYQDFNTGNSNLFLFIGSASQLIDVTIDDKQCTDVPICRNYQTNIIINQ